MSIDSIDNVVPRETSGPNRAQRRRMAKVHKTSLPLYKKRFMDKHQIRHTQPLVTSNSLNMSARRPPLGKRLRFMLTRFTWNAGQRIRAWMCRIAGHTTVGSSVGNGWCTCCRQLVSL